MGPPLKVEITLPRRPWALGLALAFFALVSALTAVYFFVDPAPPGESAADLEAPESAPGSYDATTGQWVRPVPGSGMVGVAGYGREARAPGVPRAKRAGGPPARRPPTGNLPDLLFERTELGAQAPKAGPLRRLSAMLHALVGSSVGPRSDFGSRAARLFQTQPDAGPRTSHAYYGQGVRQAGSPPKSGPPLRRAAGLSNLPIAPVGPSRGAGSYGALARDPGPPAVATALASKDAAQPRTWAPPVPDAAPVATQSAGGGPIGGGGPTGGSSGRVPTTLAPINTAGTIWGMDLATLYKKLKALGVSSEQFKALENCLAGIGCAGGDIWEACNKALVLNACASVCRDVPGCVVPGGGTGPTPGPTPGPTCTPSADCRPDGVIVEIDTCGVETIVYSDPKGCCSCGTSNYVADNPGTTYANTGIGCVSGCSAGHFCVHFCSH